MRRESLAPDFISRGETAKLLGVSLPGLVTMMFDAGDPLPFYVVGARYKFDRAEVLDYCRRRARELVKRKQAEKSKLKAARRKPKAATRRPSQR